jgi:hypothetical protein
LKPFNYYDLVECFAEPGCAICNLCQRDVNRFIDSHLYEYVNTPETHAAMRASRWLCAIHSAQLVNYGASVLGIAILEAAVLDELLKISAQTPTGAGARLTRILSRGSNGNAELAENLEPERQCLACEVLHRAEASHLRALVSHLDDPRLEAAYRESQGLCLPHFRTALRLAPGAGVTDMLVTIQSRHWQKLKAQLETFADKYDVNHADQAMGAEGDSWHRALNLLAGHPQILGLRTSTESAG